MLRGGVGCTLIKVLNAFLSLALTILLARILGSDQYGTYAYIFALISVLSLPVQFGLPTLIIRETAKAKALENWNRLRGVWRWCILVSVIGSLAISLLSILIILIFGRDLSGSYFNTLLWALLLLPLLALGKLRDGALRGLSHTVLGHTADLIIRPASFTLLILAISAAGATLTASYAMALHVLAAALAFIIGSWILSHALPKQVRARPEPEYNSKIWFYGTLPLAFSAGMQLVNQHTDILMLGFYVENSQIADYNIAAKCSIFLAFGFQTIRMLVVPYFSRFYNNNEIKRLQRLVLISSRIVLVTTLIPALIVLFFGQSIINIIFGTVYSAAYTPLLILCIGQIATATFGPAGSLLNMTDHANDTALALGISACTNIILNFLLIPYFGLNGAATATSISALVLHLTLFFKAYQKTGINTSPILLGKFFAEKPNE